MAQINGSFCVRQLCQSDSEASIHQNTNDRFMALLLRPFPPLHRYYLLNFAATLELFNLASMKAWGKLWREDLHPHAGKGESYHGLTPCFSSKECLIRTAWAGLRTPLWAWRGRLWRGWVSVSMAALEEKAWRAFYAVTPHWQVCRRGVLVSWSRAAVPQSLSAGRSV